MKRIIKILPDTTAAKNTCTGGVLRLIGISNPSDVDGEVLMHSSCYKEIFGVRKKNTGNSKKRLSIVKITANGKSIYRAYRSVSAVDFVNDCVGLSPNSILLLNDKNGNDPIQVELSKGHCFPYYWYHPDKAIRLSVKLGGISLLLGVISIAVSIVGLFNDYC